ncbi:MAG: phospholipase D-like domain-containing protein [Candidatus Hydrogenedentes bacterium]|nr:phospholipase D-like domain-containing protein [Candidatus Hydrogenedentota bacterium]
MYKNKRRGKYQKKVNLLVCLTVGLILLLFLNYSRITGVFNRAFCVPLTTTSASSINPENITVSFSPGTPGAVNSEILNTLEKLLWRARYSIYGAIYDFDYEPIAEILIKKFQQGIDVKLVVEADNSKERAVLLCEQAGIPVLKDLNRAYMHNKFFVVDNLYTWTGSTNLTKNCLFFNNNNSIILPSREVAEDYLGEFTEMFNLKNFGRGSSSNTKYSDVRLSTAVVSVYFSPDDKVEEKLLQEIGKSRRKIYFLAFSLTSKSVADQLASARAKGLEVKGVFEKKNAGNTSSKDEFLYSNGIEVRYDSNPKTMHNKVFIFDEETVWTGSYNFSANAEKGNDENVIIIRAREVAQAYIREFQRLFDTGVPMRI